MGGNIDCYLDCCKLLVSFSISSLLYNEYIFWQSNQSSFILQLHGNYLPLQKPRSTFSPRCHYQVSHPVLKPLSTNAFIRTLFSMPLYLLLAQHKSSRISNRNTQFHPGLPWWNKPRLRQQTSLDSPGQSSIWSIWSQEDEEASWTRKFRDTWFFPSCNAFGMSFLFSPIDAFAIVDMWWTSLNEIIRNVRLTVMRSEFGKHQIGRMLLDWYFLSDSSAQMESFQQTSLQITYEDNN